MNCKEGAEHVYDEDVMKAEDIDKVQGPGSPFVFGAQHQTRNANFNGEKKGIQYRI